MVTGRWAWIHARRWPRPLWTASITERLILPSNADHSWKQPSYQTISSLVDNYNVGLILQSVGLQVWFITCWAFQGTWESAAPNTGKPDKVLWLTVVQFTLFYLNNWLGQLEEATCSGMSTKWRINVIHVME